MSLGRWRCLKPRMTALVVIQGHLIGHLYTDEMLMSVVLPFLCENQALDENARTQLTRISKNNGVCIKWSVRLSDMSTILTCL